MNTLAVATAALHDWHTNPRTGRSGLMKQEAPIMAAPTAMELAMQQALIRKAKTMPATTPALEVPAPTFPRRPAHVVGYFARRIRIHATKLPQEYRGYANAVRPTAEALTVFVGRLMAELPTDDARMAMDAAWAVWHPTAPDFAVGLLAEWLGWMSDVDVDPTNGIGYDIIDAGHHLLAVVTVEVERRRASNRGEA